jgi:hypothetical protein
MDFIERIFHVAPDGGSGILEFALMFVLFIGPVALAAIRKKRGRRSWALTPSRVTRRGRTIVSASVKVGTRFAPWSALRSPSASLASMMRRTDSAASREPTFFAFLWPK